VQQIGAVSPEHPGSASTYRSRGGRREDLLQITDRCDAIRHVRGDGTTGVVYSTVHRGMGRLPRQPRQVRFVEYRRCLRIFPCTILLPPTRWLDAGSYALCHKCTFVRSIRVVPRYPIRARLPHDVSVSISNANFNNDDIKNLYIYIVATIL
jgi:hypothetical protein